MLYLRHAFNLSDEALVECWSETTRWQYCCGQAWCEDNASSFRLESGGLDAVSPQFVIFTQKLSILER